MAQVRVSDISGEIINQGTGAALRLVFEDESRGVLDADLTDSEASAVLRALGFPGSPEGQTAKTYSVARIREKHPQAYERWSADDEQRLLELKRQGFAARKIAVELGRQPSAIRSRLARLAATG